MIELNLDNTMLSTYRACPRKYFYRHQLYLTKDYTSPPLQYGVAVHRAIELAYKGAEKTTAIEVALAEYEKVFDKTDEDEWRTPKKLKELLTQYFEREQLPLVVVGGKLWVEETSKVPLYTLVGLGENDSDVQINYVGKIDSVVNWNGDIYVQDFKTTSALVGTKETGKSISNMFWNGMYPHAATIGYLWSLKQLLPVGERERIKGVIIEGIGSNKYGIAIEKRTFSYTDDQIEEWLEGTKETSRRLFYDLKYDGVRQNFDACTDFGSVCAFHDICRVPVKLREGVISMYKKDEWNPLKKKEIEA